MRTFRSALLLLATATGLAWQAHAGTIVNDTWIDGTRDDPNVANGYSENGVDLDLDGNIESLWYRGPTATSVTVVNPNPGVTPGVIRANFGTTTGSMSLTTYFTPAASPVTLSAPGQQIKVTWVFTPSGVNSASTGQGFRVGLVDWPEATLSRLTSDIAPSSSMLAVFPGYAMFMNMNTTLVDSNPFQLRERSTTATTFLANTAGWTSLADQEDSGITGYANGTQYTLLFTATLNDLGGLDLAASMTGGSLGGDGSLNVAFTDPTPNSLTFDTFGIRPSSVTEAFQEFDTSLFRVELIVVPEPSIFALLGVGALGLVALGRRSQR